MSFLTTMCFLSLWTVASFLLLGASTTTTRVDAWSTGGPDYYWGSHSPQPAAFTTAAGGGDAVLGLDSTLNLLLHCTNEERRRYGLHDLHFSPQLSVAAQRHAVCMAENGYFSHTGRQGTTVTDRVLRNTSYRYDKLAENLFWRSPDNDPAAAVEGWMTSTTGHRENILSEEFSEVGLGYASSGSEHYYVQVFGHPLTTPAIVPESTRDVLFHLTNQARRNAHLHPLVLSAELNEAAQKHADDLAFRGGSFSSSSSSSGGGIPRVDSYQYHPMGTNFASREPFNDPYSVVKGWLEQPDSSRILYAQLFTDMGVGYAVSGDRHYYVQLLGTPNDVRNGPIQEEPLMMLQRW
jgi:uncharacterized protein YkwD